MCLDADNPRQTGREIVQMILSRLRRAIEIYNERAADCTAPPMSDSIVREHFLRPQMRHREKARRTLITTFISFLAEWDYRSQMIDLSARGSKEPFFTHLFRGCLLFESLLKNSKTARNKKLSTLGALLHDTHFKQRLGIGKITTGSDNFGTVVRSLQRQDRSIQSAIQCTAQARNTLGHNLVWATQSLGRKKYDLLANSIVSSCLHAIATLYVRP
jgi:hypothetical protein